MNRRQGKRIMNKPQKFLFIVCKPSPGSAQSKSRTQNYRITDGLCRLKGFFCCIGDKGRQYRFFLIFRTISLNSSLSSAAGCFHFQFQAVLSDILSKLLFSRAALQDSVLSALRFRVLWRPELMADVLPYIPM